MSIGKYRVPRELKDEDKWLHHMFTKRQLAFIIVALLIGFGLVAIFSSLHLLVVGIVLAIIVLLAALAMTYLRMPKSRHTKGGGMGFDVLAKRVLMRKRARNRVVYTKCAEFEEEERVVKDRKNGGIVNAIRGVTK